MARPRSDDKRQAILEAAIEVIAMQGLSAPTATIAQKAGVASGSLFTYFATKAALWNALYVMLKQEMAETSQQGLAVGATARDEFMQVWTNWLKWATDEPERRKVLMLLGTSDEISAQSRHAGQLAMAPLARLIERCRAAGPKQAASLGFLSALANAVAEATIDYILGDPANAPAYRRDGFEAVWRILA